jgi:hypothetical protein
MGKIRATPRMRSHISVHRATTKYSSNSFVFKNEIEKEGLPGDITPALGAGGPEFKSRRPDQNISRVFFSLLKARLTPTPICGIPTDLFSFVLLALHPSDLRSTSLICSLLFSKCSARIQSRDIPECFTLAFFSPRNMLWTSA